MTCLIGAGIFYKVLNKVLAFFFILLSLHVVYRVIKVLLSLFLALLLLPEPLDALLPEYLMLLPRDPLHVLSFLVAFDGLEILSQ